MYSSEFRDNVYQQQNGRPPWITSEHVENAINWLDQKLSDNMKWKHILDYGCGNGDIWWNFLKKWADVDFAEISSKMVELLKKKYLYSKELLKILDGEGCIWKSKVFLVKTPHDLTVEGGVMIILLCGRYFTILIQVNGKNF